jgi:hypothetical protein
MFIGIGITIYGSGRPPTTAPRIALSDTTIGEDAAGDTEIGTASVANAPEGVTYTWAITSDPDSKFDIVEATGVLSLATLATLNFESASSHSVTIEATPSAGDPPPPRTFTIVVTNVIEAPVNTVAPVVSGALSVGSTLSCTTGTWTDLGAGSFAYQWKDAADDSNISGATASTLLLTGDHVDLELYCEVTATNAADSTAQASNTVGPVTAAPDVTAPVLSNANATTDGYTAADLAVDTDEANGTLYWVVTTSATPPSAAQIKAGQNHAGAATVDDGSQSVSGTGTQNAAASGLTNGTAYHAYFMHEDASSNQSNVVADSFTTDAFAVPDAFEVGDWSVAAGDEEADVTISSLPAANGATITDVEYRLDGGSWVSSGGTISFTITGLTNDQEYDVELRAVNSVGNGAVSDVKSVTPGDGGSSYETESEAIFAAFTTPPDDTRKGHINSLVAELKAASAWDDFVFLYVHAAADSQAAKINWKNPGSLTATEVNSPSFTTDRGFTGNGTSSYLSSGYNLSSGGGVYTQNSAHMGSYAITNVDGTRVDISINGASPGAWVVPRTSNNITIRANDATTTSRGGTVTTSVGHTMWSRTGASLVRVYRDGSQVGADVTVASTGIANDVVRVGAGASTFSNRQIAIAHIGAGLSDAKAAAIASAFATYLTAVGAI